jgi:hypothetical protein
LRYALAMPRVRRRRVAAVSRIVAATRDVVRVNTV